MNAFYRALLALTALASLSACSSTGSRPHFAQPVSLTQPGVIFDQKIDLENQHCGAEYRQNLTLHVLSDQPMNRISNSRLRVTLKELGAAPPVSLKIHTDSSPAADRLVARDASAGVELSARYYAHSIPEHDVFVARFERRLEGRYRLKVEALDIAPELRPLAAWLEIGCRSYGGK